MNNSLNTEDCASLDRFVNCYVSNAFELMKERIEMNADDFAQELISRVSSQTGKSKEFVRNLYNPFHWKLLSGEKSPFEIFIENVPENGSYHIRARAGKNPLGVKVISDEILGDYSVYFRARIKRFNLEVI